MRRQRRHCVRCVFALLLVGGLAPGAQAVMYFEFQQGVAGYEGTVDTFLKQALPSFPNGGLEWFEWDGADGGGQNIGLLRFDSIFGNGPGQIPAGATILGAELAYNNRDTGNSATVHNVLVDWDESVTYNTFGGDIGVQADEYGPSIGSASGGSNSHTIDVTSSLAAWSADPSQNRGWIFRPTGTDGVEVRSSENASIPLRPKLTVFVDDGQPAQKILRVRHAPYLQLGNAPLAATPIAGVADFDQVVIVWQTVEFGLGAAPDDDFEVEYRAAGAPTYAPAGPIATLDTGAGTRVNHSVVLTGLAYDQAYEYRVTHKRHPATPVVVATYEGAFRTRLAPGATTPFSFAAYGDSAYLASASELAAFERVMQRVTTLDAAFVLLLGDNVYDLGTHDEFDGRLDGEYVPNQSAYIRNHVEYFTNGNHEIGGPTGPLPSLQNYDCPIPVRDVTSPVDPPVGETPELNYSFDYGMVHFAVIDSTAWGGGASGYISATRQANILTWLAADLAASNATWKVVASHHPPKSWMDHGDTGEGLAAELMPVLVASGADLLLVGHSHNYQRSFPITGYQSGNVTWQPDPSGVYAKGQAVIEFVAGTGGRVIRGTAPVNAEQWLARAFGENNGGEVGPLMLNVTEHELQVRYVTALNGTVLDSIRIVDAPILRVTPAALAPTTTQGGSPPDDAVTIRNGGTGTLNYEITDNAAWLDVTPATGSSSGEDTVVAVQYATASLLPGPHSATITIADPNAANTPQTIAVSLTIAPVGPDLDGDGDVDLSDFGTFQACFNGPNRPPSFAGCGVADFDSDSDVDLADFGVFLTCFNGQGRPPACG